MKQTLDWSDGLSFAGGERDRRTRIGRKGVHGSKRRDTGPMLWHNHVCWVGWGVVGRDNGGMGARMNDRVTSCGSNLRSQMSQFRLSSASRSYPHVTV